MWAFWSPGGCQMLNGTMWAFWSPGATKCKMAQRGAFGPRGLPNVKWHIVGLLAPRGLPNVKCIMCKQPAHWSSKVKLVNNWKFWTCAMLCVRATARSIMCNAVCAGDCSPNHVQCCVCGRLLAQSCVMLCVRATARPIMCNAVCAGDCSPNHV